MQHRHAFGTWKSNFDAKAASAGSIKLRDCFWDGDDLYWVETRPQEKGRSTLMHWNAVSDKTPKEILPPPWNIRSRVHEYGGQAACARNGKVFFVHADDQQIYRWQPSLEENPVPLTSAPSSRFVDLAPHPTDTLLLAVEEIHTTGSHIPTNRIVTIDTENGKVVPLFEGQDFYSTPRFSPNGQEMSWLSWNHPQMPWDGTELYVGLWKAGKSQGVKRVAGSQTESVSQPRWSPLGELYFASDRTGWWNLYRRDRTGRIDAIAPREREFCRPEWNFGQSQFGFFKDDGLFCAFSEQGMWRTAIVDASKGVLGFSLQALPYTEVDCVTGCNNRIAFIGSHPKALPALVVWTAKHGPRRLRALSLETLEPASLSTPKSIVCAGEAGEVHFFYYPPCNAEYPSEATDGPPPVIVLCHGGPTAAASTGLNPVVQFWTTRGFAIADVNYSGSTGFGRPYRDRLKGQWGKLEVADCAAVARHLVSEKLANAGQVAIRGSSAGGLTVLNALIEHPVFKAGASYYGVTDLTALAQDSHKFEAHYLDSLVGPWPDARSTYEARSPIRRAAELAKPVIFFQGLKDRVVPPAQSENMHRLLLERGIATRYLSFAGEGHGFRQSETLIQTLESELAFYIQVFGLA